MLSALNPQLKQINARRYPAWCGRCNTICKNNSFCGEWKMTGVQTGAMHWELWCRINEHFTQIARGFAYKCDRIRLQTNCACRRNCSPWLNVKVCRIGLQVLRNSVQHIWCTASNWIVSIRPKLHCQANQDYHDKRICYPIICCYRIRRWIRVKNQCARARNFPHTRAL